MNYEHHLRKSKSGLTLVELVIAITLLGLVVLSAVAIDTAAHRFLHSEETQARLAREVSLVLERISKDISLSFGYPEGFGFAAFIIINPGPDIGNQIYFRRIPFIAPERPNMLDTFFSYRLDSNNNLIEFNDSCIPFFPPPGDCGANWVTVAENVDTTNPIFQAIDSDNDGNGLDDNLIRVEITCRQNPGQGVSVTNPEVTLASTVRIPAIASQ